jgi:signal transduction histidine kinase
VHARPPGLNEPQHRRRSIGTKLRLSTLSLVVLLAVLVGGGILLVGLPSLKLKIIGSGVQQASVPAVPALAALQSERQQALAYLATPGGDVAAFQQQEAQTSQGLAAMQAAAASALAGAPPEITSRLQSFTDLLRELPQQRNLVETRSAAPEQVFAFYNSVLDAATRLFDAQARVVPDAEITQSAIAAVALFQVADDMSRAGSLAAGALADQSFAVDDYRQFQRLVGTYHTDLDRTAQYLEPDVQVRYDTIVHGPAYRRLSGIEDALIERGPDPHKTTGRDNKADTTVTVPFPVGASEWSSTTSTVSRQLADLTVAQANDIATLAADTGAKQFWTVASVLGALTLATAAAAVVGIRLATRVSRRLSGLAEGVHKVATEQVPELVRQVRDGHAIDLSSSVQLLDDKPDEIGDAAARFREAVIADLQGRRREILLRAGVTRVLKELAHRIQLPVSRLLSTVYTAQEKEQNPDTLRLLYSIDHEVIRARRIADHMIVLAGDQPRHPRRDPVPLFHILQGAATETSTPETSDPARQLQRFALQNIPEVSVKPLLAHQVAHLLSELMDNAVRYSPPNSLVRLSGEVTAHGVAIEIADAGVGLPRDRLDAVNALMRNPPEFDAMVREEAISQLGFFVVAHLARALHMVVTFQVSAFQGLSAVVIFPGEVLAQPDEEHQDMPESDGRPPARAESAWFSPEEPVKQDATVMPLPTPALPARIPPSGTAVREQRPRPRHARLVALPDEPTETPSGSLPPLPKRSRGATFTASGRPDTTRPDLDTPPDDFDVETTGSQLSQLQRGTQRGREAAGTAEDDPHQWPAWPRYDERRQP